MTFADLGPLLPIIVLATGAVVTMLAIAFGRNHKVTFALSAATFIAGLVSILLVAPLATRRVTALLLMDNYALLYVALILLASLAVAMLSYGYLESYDGQKEEFYLLLILATLGSCVLAASSHFVSFFLGLEILSVSLYAMVAYRRGWDRSIEAGIKYLILAATSAAFLLFGMALVYAELGTMEFGRMAAAGGNLGVVTLAGLALLVVGIGYKLAVVPFHLWTPDVYEGAPAPATAFVATVSKGAMFALLLRYFNQVDILGVGSIWLVFALIAIASMLAGNLLALLQDNVKRILAYSSIAHLGYALVAFLAGGALGAAAGTFYMAAYMATSLVAFGVVAALSTAESDADRFDDYRGLYWRRPWLAGLFTLALVSLAGIPLTAGFIGKFLILTAGAGVAAWALVLVVVVSSSIGAFYYLRLTFAMYARTPDGDAVRVPVAPALSPVAGIALAASAILVVILGVYPGPLLEAIQAAVAGIV
ncbi:MAG TPA: NADH-quinone oxidoreductase subunit N [Chloroflexota bacterium]|nr:NADH-quinone oxidoreductase subunit N [Chloroflexota bacterium]